MQEEFNAEELFREFEKRGEEIKKEEEVEEKGEKKITPEEMSIIQDLIKDVPAEEAESVSRKMTAAMKALKESPLYKGLSPKELKEELKRLAGV